MVISSTKSAVVAYIHICICCSTVEHRRFVSQVIRGSICSGQLWGKYTPPPPLSLTHTHSQHVPAAVRAAALDWCKEAVAAKSVEFAPTLGTADCGKKVFLSDPFKRDHTHQ